MYRRANIHNNPDHSRCIDEVRLMDAINISAYLNTIDGSSASIKKVVVCLLSVFWYPYPTPLLIVPLSRRGPQSSSDRYSGIWDSTISGSWFSLADAKSELAFRLPRRRMCPMSLTSCDILDSFYDTPGEGFPTIRWHAGCVHEIVLINQTRSVNCKERSIFEGDSRA